MRVLLTGASSFSGMWIAQALAMAGYEVTAVARTGSYADPLRQARMERVAAIAEIITDAPFGSDRFIGVVKDGRFDAVGLHGAEVGDYKSPNYDMAAAVAANTLNAEAVFAAA